MANNNWKILRGAVEQEIIFNSEKDYDAYIEKISNSSYRHFQVVSKEVLENGTVFAVMRKNYNGNVFLPAGEVGAVNV